MKRLLVFICAVPLMFSCNSNSGNPASAMNDSLVQAAAAKDSMLARNKATALASQEALNAGKYDDMYKDFATDGSDYGDGSMAPVKGVDSMKAMFKSFINAFPDMKGENFIAVAEGNQVAVFGDWTGTFKNPLMGMKPTGKSFKFRDVDLFTFNDAGKITEHRSVQSFATILQQVGAKMRN
jgi:predicted ester cyclase